jgi:hypothetical protein
LSRWLFALDGEDPAYHVNVIFNAFNRKTKEDADHLEKPNLQEAASQTPLQVSLPRVIA